MNIYIEHNPKDTIENLELWLRNLIHVEFTKKYGANYFDGKDECDNNIMNKSIIDTYNERVAHDPERYARKIDSLQLDDLKSLISKEHFYKNIFKHVFSHEHILGKNLFLKYMNEIIPIRNRLSHTNPISQRDYEKCICYSHDIIDFIKDYYKRENMEKNFNVPTILYIQDSMGNYIDSSKCGSFGGKVVLQNKLKNNGILNVGDTIKLVAEIDNSFNDDEYKVQWIYPESSKLNTIEGKTLEIEITLNHIRELFYINCEVIQNKSWHKYEGTYDDKIQICYSVIPPQDQSNKDLNE